MNYKTKWICCFIIFFFSFSLLTYADVKIKGEISGKVVDENGEVLPGVTVTLTGAKLFQKFLYVVSTEKGLFRFLNLIPGSYEIDFRLQEFNPKKITNVKVSVGKTTPILATLTIVKIKEEVEVIAEAPLIETKTTQILTSYTSMMIEKLPTNRNLLDLMDAVPGINDKGAYGAGGRADTGAYDTVYTQGSATSTYLLNGVDISDVDRGTTWVNPVYETIEEIQVVGIGASAEYGGFTGASFNAVTKSGSNEFHGGLSFYYTDNRLYADNSGGIEDLKPGDVKYNPEAVAFLGGPLIKEKLFFFLAGGYTGKKSKGYGEYKYGILKQPHFQLKLDWLASKNNTLTLMVNLDPLDHSDLGQVAGSGPEIAYNRIFRSTTLFGSWQSIFNDKTFFDLKYAGFRGRQASVPANPNDIAVRDSTTGRRYGSYGIIRESLRTRNQVNASLAHYADDFFGASHEFKFGLEYERSYAENNTDMTGPDASIMSIYPAVGTYGQVIVSVGYSIHSKSNVERISIYAQDNIRIGSKVYLNLGMRFDVPRLTMPGVSGAVAKYTNIAPRIGFSYDFGGDAKNVVHLHYGRYFQKMVSFGFSPSMPGGQDIAYYSYFISEPFVYSEENVQTLFSTVVKPENILWIRTASQPWDVESGLTAPYTDVFNIGFEKMLGNDFALSIDYLYKRDRHFLQQSTRTQHTYEEIQWTDPYLGNTVALWLQSDNLPEEYYLNNGSFAKRRHHFLMVVLRKREIGNWSMMASFTYQRSEGNISNTGSESLGWAFAGRDTDPNYTENPLMWGIVDFDRTYQFKLLGTYLLPGGFSISADLRLLSGRAWTPNLPYWYTPASRQAYYPVFLEKRGSRRFPMEKNLSIRLGKAFRLGDFSNLEIFVDILNALNADNIQGINMAPYAVYPLSQENSFGKPTGIYPPRRARLGLRLKF